MEFIDGPSLKEAVDSYKKSFPISAVVTILRGVLEGLAVAHKAGLIHRDLKPANILLNHPLNKLSKIPRRAVKITDFGLGKVGGNLTQSIMQSGSLLTEEGKSISGTIAYMSPEQREGGEVDARSDLYACGIILFEMLTGERPQGGELPGSIRPGVPGFLDQVFQRCYTRWERRYASARDMLAALESRAPDHGTPTVPIDSAHNRCPGCRGAVQRDDQFCIRCGRQLVAAIPRCSGCRAFVRPGDQFCIFCGNDLRVLVG
jgi:serine/threonine protein kinase